MAGRRGKLLAVERRTRILDLLHQRGSVTVAELSAAHGVSEETVRRDLEKLESESGIARTHGGAYVARAVNSDVPIRIREGIQLEVKEIIGGLCERLVEDGETLMLDSSTTALHVAEHIRAARARVTVVTNALRVADAFADCEGVTLVCTGGALRRSQLSFVGPATVEMLRHFYADKAFVSCVAVDLENGLTDADELEADVRRTMLHQAREKLLIADYTKLGKTSFALIAPLDRVNCLVTDREPDARWMAELARRKVRCIHGRK